MVGVELTDEKLSSALSWCVERKEFLEQDGCCIPPAYRDKKEYDALQILSACTEKQVAMAVEVRTDKWKDERYYCPVCRKQQGGQILGKPIWCERCGQKLYVNRENNDVTKNRD